MKIHKMRPVTRAARNDLIQVRVTPAERDAIFAAASAHGISVSELVRKSPALAMLIDGAL